MKKSIILSILALIAVFAALLLFSGEDQPKEKETPPPTPVMAKAPVAPPVEEAPVSVDDPALKEALLGLNKKAAVEGTPAPRPIRRRARPTETIEEAQPEEEVDTELTDYEFQSTVGSWSGVKSCIATKSQRGEEKLTGAIQLAFTIQGDGNVVESKVVDVSNEDAATLAPCVEKQAKHIRFPAFASNEPVTKTAKFVF
jgi:hypothetical protein